MQKKGDRGKGDEPLLAQWEAEGAFDGSLLVRCQDRDFGKPGWLIGRDLAISTRAMNRKNRKTYYHLALFEGDRYEPSKIVVYGGSTFAVITADSCEITAYDAKGRFPTERALSSVKDWLRINPTVEGPKRPDEIAQPKQPYVVGQKFQGKGGFPFGEAETL